MSTGTNRDCSTDSLREILKTVWRLENFRPLQAEAIQATLAGRDVLLILPTGVSYDGFIAVIIADLAWCRSSG